MKLRKLFDAAFYLRANPDVAAARMDPLKHYIRYGAAEQRQPHPLFDPAHYLAICPEARKAGNPLLHFLEQSGAWANPHPLFDCEAYMRAHPDAKNPLVDYVENSRRSAEEGSQFGQC
ncbi:MAG: ubiquinone/menaquinone biosynthesis C-methylase UbiE [Bryobacterales bacterium]|nr:ubiquinone/menaquinone biosynthesis C-methylase UbiE [Bryobacterales bacterium]